MMVPLYAGPRPALLMARLDTAANHFATAMRIDHAVKNVRIGWNSLDGRLVVEFNRRKSA